MWTMRRHQAYKYEILPNGEQQRRMRRFAGSCLRDLRHFGGTFRGRDQL